MAASAHENIDYRLLDRLSNLVICSSCLRRGKVTPVPQVISNRHSLTNECPDCRSANEHSRNRHRVAGRVLTLKR